MRNSADPLAQPPPSAGGLFDARPSPPTTATPAPPEPPPQHPAPGTTAHSTPREGTDAYKFLAVLLHLGDAAIWQVAAALHRPDHTVSQRFSEMERAGWIKRLDETNLRPHSHKRCHLYRALVDLSGKPVP